MKLPLSIIATGKALPSERLLSSDLDARLGLQTGTVAKKSGIQWRYFASAEQTQSQLAAEALQDACQHHGIDTNSIDLLICASAIPEQVLPNTASAVIQAAGLKNGLAAFDVNASCISFMTALFQAAALLQTKVYRRIAIVSAEIASRGLNWDDAESSFIFGDGAAAVIVEAGDGIAACVAQRLEVHPVGRTFCQIKAGGTQRNPRMGLLETDHYFQMQGKPVFKLASQLLPAFIHNLFSDLPYTFHEVDWVVPHQASHLSMEHLKNRLGLDSQKIIDIYATHGNQVAASMPMALHELYRSGKTQSGQKVLLIGTAAGFAMGGMVLSL
ncbi:MULTISPECIES: 3-oxoacyl-ACP synthase [Vitreoscilla]|uniref:3-oxoacyl-ACP synthase n=1 Tax=Vitreoscilla stercoraria TaxID=61 RepID=A0ABY4E7X1_VITST|nr:MULTISPECIES: 3-oxoacyl-ACP synthase [Vitreoscilla]AUZ04900.1 3-oxoacyl-ACP synthase 3 [Vitreoscilla sp. C1]UOO91446.1 3-oxoacyl-ACP synthase [Vitreoscilla stercoraria]